MARSRIYYATHAVGLAAGSTSFPSSTTFLHGVNSVGLSTSIDFEQIFELGHLAIYENVEGVPSVEVTIERTLNTDQSPIYNIIGAGVEGGFNGLGGESQLGNFAEARVTLQLSVAASGAGTWGSAEQQDFGIEIQCYPTNYSVNVQTDGSATESVSFTGESLTYDATTAKSLSNVASTGVTFPRLYCGSGPSGVNSASFSVDIGREDLLELGRKGPYLKYTTFPLEVTYEREANVDPASDLHDVFTGFSTTQDTDVNEANGYTFSISGVRSGKSWIYSCSGMKMTAENYSGGDTGGGVVTKSQTYQGFNNLQLRLTGY